VTCVRTVRYATSSEEYKSCVALPCAPLGNQYRIYSDRVYEPSLWIALIIIANHRIYCILYMTKWAAIHIFAIGRPFTKFWLTACNNNKFLKSKFLILEFLAHKLYCLYWGPMACPHLLIVQYTIQYNTIQCIVYTLYSWQCLLSKLYMAIYYQQRQFRFENQHCIIWRISLYNPLFKIVVSIDPLLWKSWLFRWCVMKLITYFAHYATA
jgi:hypothetical protein